MERTAQIISIALFAVVVSLTTYAQDMTPPTYCCGPSFTYCQAKEHEHGAIIETYGRFANNGIANSECNNGGNNFLGNTIRLRYWGRTEVFWYDWSVDPTASAIKISVWGSNPYEPLTIRYCSTCKMVLSVTSPKVPY